MKRRHIECFEVIVLALDFRAFGDAKAKPEENLSCLFDNAVERVNMSVIGLSSGEGYIDALLREFGC